MPYRSSVWSFATAAVLSYCALVAFHCFSRIAGRAPGSEGVVWRVCDALLPRVSGRPTDIILSIVYRREE